MSSKKNEKVFKTEERGLFVVSDLVFINIHVCFSSLSFIFYIFVYNPDLQYPYQPHCLRV